MSNDQNVRIHELLDCIRDGRIMEAMQEFYDEQVVMEEPACGRTVGLGAHLSREQQFVDSVAEFKKFEAPVVTVGDGPRATRTSRTGRTPTARTCTWSRSLSNAGATERSSANAFTTTSAPDRATRCFRAASGAGEPLPHYIVCDVPPEPPWTRKDHS